MKPKIHILSVPHTITSPDWSLDPFTIKVVNFIRMMQGNAELLHYGNEASHVACENIPVTDNATLIESSPDNDPFYWKERGIRFKTESPVWRQFFRNTERELQKRLGSNDIVLLFLGAMLPLYEKLGRTGVWVEPSVGYSISYLPRRIFQTFAWYHHTWGKQQNRTETWRVIPFFANNPKDFVPVPKPRRDYLLFIARVQKDKGIDIAIQAAQIYNQQQGNTNDLPIVIAGPNTGQIEFPKEVIYAGYAESNHRLNLLQNAAAVFCPTRYCEPGSNTAVEAQYCGTPVIASNFGCFTETVPPHAGVLCDTLQHFVDAIPKAMALDRARISQHAKEKYDHDKIADQFLKTFHEYQSI